MFGIRMILDAHGRPTGHSTSIAAPAWVQRQAARVLRESIAHGSRLQAEFRVAELYASLGETPLASTVVGSTVRVRLPERYRCS